MRRALAALVLAASLTASAAAPSVLGAQPGAMPGAAAESRAAVPPADEPHSAASPSADAPSAASASTVGASTASPSTAARSAAADPRIEAQTKQLASVLRCPVCQGLSIEDSPTELSHQMKDVIRSQLVEGKTPDEVKAYFVARYGEWILLEPEAAGINLLIYVLPFVGLLVGAVVIVLCVKRWTRAPSLVPQADADDASVSAA